MTLVGSVGLHKRFKAIANTESLLQEVQLRAVREAKLLAPRKTGNLGRSIAPGRLTARSAEIVARANYAAFVELGTRPHDIRPKRRKALRFAVGGNARLSGRPRRGGDVIFAKKVHHPGTKPHPFMEPGARKAIEQVTVQEIVKDWNAAD